MHLQILEYHFSKMKTVMAEDKYIYNNNIFNNELTNNKRKYFKACSRIKLIFLRGFHQLGVSHAVKKIKAFHL